MSRKIFGQIWLALFGLAFLVSCTQQNVVEPVLLQGKTMGTTFHIKYYPVENVISSEQLLAEVNKELQHVNQLMSTYIPDSELSLLNKTPANVEFLLSEENVFLLNESLRIHQISGGAFDVTIGPLVNLWGFGPQGRVTKRPSEEQVNQTLLSIGENAFELTGSKVIKYHDDTYIDFSAIAKGYGVDQIAALIQSHGINSYLVEIGGEIKTSGIKPNGSAWRVAIEKPSTTERQTQLIVELKDMAMATSGDYRNYFEQDGVRFSHTIDATTGQPITHNLASVTVLHESSATADALATAINVMGADTGLVFAEEYNIAAYMLVKSDSGFDAIASSAFQPYLEQPKAAN
ncbi:MAG: FAD:protein FMN transferase [Gammaproteobacteria bacterium]|nr:FAD:protein FMN transferase [Gammaproteobacteria bacterium]